MVGIKVFIFVTPLIYTLICNAFYHSNAGRQIKTNRPIIGILAQSTNGMFEYFGRTYIAASYVKFLESSGARIVPIMNNLTEVEIKKLFKSINGAVFPGGIVSPFTSGYANTSRIIFELAKKTFEEGGYFPIMGMCLGHQLLGILVHNANKDIRVPTDSHDMIAPLNLLKHYRESKLFRDVPKDLIKPFNETPITAHFHHFSLPLRLFQESENLKNFYNVLTTNIGRNGTEFVSTMEAKKYPFYSTQWHPEKCPFEWFSNKSIPHHSTSIKLSQYISNFFVQEARFSKHKFMSEKDERAALIYNHSPLYTGIYECAVFEQTYYFN